MNWMMNMGLVFLTIALWIGYTFLCIRLEERFRWFATWGALSVPIVIVSLVLLNVWAGTTVAAILFVVFVVFGFALALDKMRF